MRGRLMWLAGVVLAVSSLSWGQIQPGNVAHVFTLDDNPAIPLTSPPGWIPGFGAEEPWGLWGTGRVPAPGFAPSPSLPAIPARDAEILVPGAVAPIPVVHLVSPDGAYIDGISCAKTKFTTVMRLDFSVDRVSTGLPGTAVASEAIFNQQPGDIYRTTRLFPDPRIFVGTLGPGPFAGWLPTAGLGGGNLLELNQSQLTLTAVGAPGVLTPPGVWTPPCVSGGPPMKDNVDGYDREPFDLSGDGITDRWIHFSINPDQAAFAGPGVLSPADIFDVAPGAGGSPGVPWARPAQMGLKWFIELESDDIDGLIVWDLPPHGGPGNGGPGAQRGYDYALFSLSPGSPTLLQYGLSPADVFFTDFSGAFAVFATAADLGLMARGYLGDNVDALSPMIFLAGDCDLDGDVDFADYQALETNFGTGSTWQQGDFDGDGDVDFADYQALETNFGKSVPEPATAVILLLGLGGVIRARRE